MLVFMTTRCVACVQYTIEFACVVSILYMHRTMMMMQAYKQAQFIYLYSYVYTIAEFHNVWLPTVEKCAYTVRWQV